MPEPRPVQLVFILPGLWLPPRVPFGSYRARSDGRFHPPPWARAQIPAEVLDDPRFCAPVMDGQLPLFEARRTLTVADASKIRDRSSTARRPGMSTTRWTAARRSGWSGYRWRR